MTVPKITQGHLNIYFTVFSTQTHLELTWRRRNYGNDPVITCEADSLSRRRITPYHPRVASASRPWLASRRGRRRRQRHCSGVSLVTSNQFKSAVVHFTWYHRGKSLLIYYGSGTWYHTSHISFFTPDLLEGVREPEKTRFVYRNPAQ